MSHEIEMENVGKEMEDHAGNDPPLSGMPENENNQYVLYAGIPLYGQWPVEREFMRITRHSNY